MASISSMSAMACLSLSGWLPGRDIPGPASKKLPADSPIMLSAALEAFLLLAGKLPVILPPVAAG